MVRAMLWRPLLLSLRSAMVHAHRPEDRSASLAILVVLQRLVQPGRVAELLQHLRRARPLPPRRHPPRDQAEGTKPGDQAEGTKPRALLSDSLEAAGTNHHQRAEVRGGLDDFNLNSLKLGTSTSEVNNPAENHASSGATKFSTSLAMRAAHAPWRRPRNLGTCTW